MTWQGTGAEAARSLGEALLSTRREAADAWAERDRWRDEAERLSAGLDAAREAMALTLWAADTLNLDGGELAAVVRAALGPHVPEGAR